MADRRISAPAALRTLPGARPRVHPIVGDAAHRARGGAAARGLQHHGRLLHVDCASLGTSGTRLTELDTTFMRPPLPE